MPDTIIRVENLGKKYTISHQQERSPYTTLRDVVASSTKSLIQKIQNPKPKIQNLYEEFWALKDVSFEVKKGEAIGIIGRNGAGKSTLLKILSRITEPTTGQISIKGRVASLLEVGTGFHPELTGRENIYLNGAILGMSKAEIKRKFDEIVAFAEVEKFLDTPVKRYSSGMYVRLAFAVAAHLEPEILIVDEVLAVGDAAFQKKCLGKMGDVAEKEGRTVLFVSHNMEATTRLCNTAIFLKNGFIQASGEVNQVVSFYLQSNFKTTAQRSWEKAQTPGNDIVRFIEVKAHRKNGDISDSFDVTESVGITIKYEVLKNGFILNPGLNILNELNINIFDSHDTSFEWRQKTKTKGIYCSTMWIPGNFLAEGIIIIGMAIISPDPFFIHLHETNVITFNIFDKLSENSSRGSYTGNFPGLIRPLLNWETVVYC